MTDNRYEIKVLKDIAKIPPDRLDEFYADLNDWLDIVRLVDKSGISDIVKIEAGMTWIDDNKRGVSEIQIKAVKNFGEIND